MQIERKIMNNDIDKIDLLISQIQEIVLPSQQVLWSIRQGNQLQCELMLQAKGDVIRCIDKLLKVKGMYPVA